MRCPSGEWLPSGLVMMARLHGARMCYGCWWEWWVRLAGDTTASRADIVAMLAAWCLVLGAWHTHTRRDMCASLRGSMFVLGGKSERVCPGMIGVHTHCHASTARPFGVVGAGRVDRRSAEAGWFPAVCPELWLWHLRGEVWTCVGIAVRAASVRSVALPCWQPRRSEVMTGVPLNDVRWISSCCFTAHTAVARSLLCCCSVAVVMVPVPVTRDLMTRLIAARMCRRVGQGVYPRLVEPPVGRLNVGTPCAGSGCA